MHARHTIPDNRRDDTFCRAAVPVRENRLWRWIRWRAERQCLLEKDGRLLLDAGLTREDVLRGVPFGPESAVRTPEPFPPQGRPATRTRIAGSLTANGWRCKLYVSDDPRAPGASDVHAASRAFRACLADPGRGPALGFAVLRSCLPEESHAPEGSVALVVWSWAGPGLHRAAILLPLGIGPAQRLPCCMLGGPEVDLLARESRSWARHVAGAASPDAEAYLAEDCS